MTLHVLHATDGYEYLTRQVANADRERERGEELTDYYHAHGTPPGHWYGSGVADLEGMERAAGVAAEDRIAVGQAVSEAQMKALYGEGMHPNAEALTVAAINDGHSSAAALTAARLGRKFPDFRNEIPVLKAHAAAVQRAKEETGKAPTADESKAILDRVGREIFIQDKGREPADDRELQSWIASEKKRVRHAAAGYDMVFTPPKSVSTLWALCDNDTRQAIEEIHKRTVHETLSWIEKEACFTRTGARSEEVQDTTGLVAALYDHYDSRAGDPNLHTHAVVSIKVQTESDGRWRALDGATLHRYAVSASQRYNAAVMQTLSTELGLSLTTRSTGLGKQDIVELADVPQEICEMFSSRRTDIEARRDELVAEYRAKHGRMPSPKTMYALYQKANTDTREGKAEPKSLAEMRQQWNTRAASILGGENVVADVLRTALAGTRDRDNLRAFRDLEEEARAVLRSLEDKRGTWAVTHVTGAVEAHLATVHFDSPDAHRAAVDGLIARVIETSIALPAPELPATPAALRRRSGEFILTTHGTAKHTSHAVLEAEQTLLDATIEVTACVAPQAELEHVLAAGERTLNPGQRALAEHFVGSGALVAVGVGPAGTGKTTSMKAVADTWQRIGHDVIALAPSAVAAETLGHEIGVQAHTLATLTYPWRGKIGDRPGAIPASIDIKPGTMLLVDEASLASTKDLAAVVEIARAKGAIVRLLGDPAQLDAVETGGALRLLAEETRAPELTDVVRFGDDEVQAENSLRVRAGEHDSMQLLADRGWIAEGTVAEMRQAAVDAYLADNAKGLHSIVMLATRDEVRAANLAIQEHHRANGVAQTGSTIALSDELTAGIGDIVITRKNRRDLRPIGGKQRAGFVRNGDLWKVTSVHPDGRLTVKHVDHDGTLELPADYVRTNTELGYASTVHRSQGITVDTAHAVTAPSMNRAGLYVALTRGRSENRVYVSLDHAVGIDTEGSHLDEIEERSARRMLEDILDRDNGHRAAITELREATIHANSPERLREAYLAAQTRLRDRHIDRILERALPAGADLTANPASLARLRASLAAIHDRGDSARAALAAAVAAGPLSTADDIAAVLAHRVALTDASSQPSTPNADALPPLPVRGDHADAELDEFARDVAARFHAAHEAPEPDADDLGGRIRRYQDATAAFDVDRVRRPVAAALGDEEADRIVADRALWRLGRHVRRAALAGIDPADMVAWHAHRLAEAGEPITASTLAADIAPALTATVRERDAAWLADNLDTVREHLPTLAHTPDEPATIAAAGRIRRLAEETGRGVDDVCRGLSDRTGRYAAATQITEALAEVAQPDHQLTNHDAPTWVDAPSADAAGIDGARAAELRAEYDAIAAATARRRDRYTDQTLDSAPEWMRHLGPRPADSDGARRWAQVAAEADAYRRTYRVTDSTSVAGERPTAGDAAADWLQVQRRVQEQQRAHQEHQQREQERQRQKAQRRVDADQQRPGHQRGGPRL